jgi:hypothetical protein
MSKTIAFFLALSVLPAAALAGGTAHTVVDNNHTTSIACKTGDSAEIAGNGNKVTVTGECANVRVTGNSNTVSIDAAESIDVLGNKNTVTWKRGLGGKDAAVSNPGTDNKVARAKS